MTTNAFSRVGEHATSPAAGAPSPGAGVAPGEICRFCGDPKCTCYLARLEARIMATPLPQTDLEQACYEQFSDLYGAFFAARDDLTRQTSTAYTISDADRYWFRLLGDRSDELKTRARLETDPGVA